MGGSPQRQEAGTTAPARSMGPRPRGRHSVIGGLALLSLAMACGSRTGLTPGGDGGDGSPPRTRDGAFRDSATAAPDGRASDGDRPWCVPACGEQVCGRDPICGESCGSCPDGQACLPAGQCAPLRWTSVASPTDGWLRDVWASGPSDLWVVGGSISAGEGPPAVILHFDGERWSWVDPPVVTPIKALWGIARDDVWAVGDEGAILHFTGDRWEVIPSGTRAGLETIWGARSEDLWVGGYDSGGVLLHREGSSFRAVDSPAPVAIHSDIWGARPRDFWILTAPSGGTATTIVHNQDGGWATPYRTRGGVNALWGLAERNIWAVGDSGAIHHFDGRWSVAAERAPGLPSLYDVWGNARDDVWATGWGTILHFDGRRWSPIESPAVEGIFGVVGTGAHDVWAVGKHGVILHYAPVAD